MSNAKGQRYSFAQWFAWSPGYATRIVFGSSHALSDPKPWQQARCGQKMWDRRCVASLNEETDMISGSRWMELSMVSLGERSKEGCQIWHGVVLTGCLELQCICKRPGKAYEREQILRTVELFSYRATRRIHIVMRNDALTMFSSCSCDCSCSHEAQDRIQGS